jgi:hypothetical protein
MRTRSGKIRISNYVRNANFCIIIVHDATFRLADDVCARVVVRGAVAVVRRSPRTSPTSSIAPSAAREHFGFYILREARDVATTKTFPRTKKAYVRTFASVTPLSMYA